MAAGTSPFQPWLSRNTSVIGDVCSAFTIDALSAPPTPSGSSVRSRPSASYEIR
ncbi:MAG: hypothetical protein R3B82_25900 [Sandaracinaceae bacterium]